MKKFIFAIGFFLLGWFANSLSTDIWPEKANLEPDLLDQQNSLSQHSDSLQRYQEISINSKIINTIDQIFTGVLLQQYFVLVYLENSINIRWLFRN